IDQTHDPKLRSWVESANRPECDFPIQNLPIGVFCPKSQAGPPSFRHRLGVAMGDFIMDIGEWLSGETLNGYMALSSTQRQDLRIAWSKALEAGEKERSLYRRSESTMLLPATVGDYTDFYASIHHATNVGRMFRP